MGIKDQWGWGTASFWGSGGGVGGARGAWYCLEKGGKFRGWVLALLRGEDLGHPLAPHLGGEHDADAISRPIQQEPPDQEAEQHHIREERAEVQHLQKKMKWGFTCGPPSQDPTLPLPPPVHPSLRPSQRAETRGERRVGGEKDQGVGRTGR